MTNMHRAHALAYDRATHALQADAAVGLATNWVDFVRRALPQPIVLQP